jgi:GxxExxY protein
MNTDLRIKLVDGQPLLHAEVSEQVIKAFYHVYNTLGHGFLEKVYEHSMAQFLRKQGLEVVQQMPIKVFFEGELVGEYFADLLVNGCLIVEIKAAEALHTAHEAQVVNYLKASPIEIGLLFNFGETPEFRRKLLTNDRKPALPQMLQAMGHGLNR